MPQRCSGVQARKQNDCPRHIVVQTAQHTAPLMIDYERGRDREQTEKREGFALRPPE